MRNSIVVLLQEVHRYYSGTLTTDIQHLFQKRWHTWLKNNGHGLIISYSHKKKKITTWKCQRSQAHLGVSGSLLITSSVA